MEQKNKKTNSNDVYLYGRHAVFAALMNPNRCKIQFLCTSETSDEAAMMCKKAGISEKIISILSKKDLEKALPPQSVHQGFVLKCKRLESMTLDDFCTSVEGQDNVRVLILDQVTDPQNIGTIIRSCAAFGCNALIVQDKNAPQETGALVKASVGTFEHMPIIRATNLSRAIDSLKKCGFWVVGMDGYAKQNIDAVDKSGKIAVVMGSEGKGMRRLIEESCDISVKLPMSEKVESLNVATAASIVLYELYK